jgi:hypothetical protein
MVPENKTEIWGGGFFPFLYKGTFAKKALERYFWQHILTIGILNPPGIHK